MRLPALGVVRWRYLDLNSYFASVEQQLRPELRARSIAVVPVEAETTCCIAASYEAKRYGIVTGTEVREAKRRTRSRSVSGDCGMRVALRATG